MPRKRVKQPKRRPLQMRADQLLLWRSNKNTLNPIWSQPFTAQWLGVSSRTYRRWETGDWPLPQWAIHRIYEFELMSRKICTLQDIPYYHPQWITPLPPN